MRVLLVNGSSRNNGCTFTALNEVARALNEEGETFLPSAQP
jgi:multimeric flavodoxin WrbA